MNKTLLAVSIVAGLSIFTFSASASNSGKSTISLGYAQSNSSQNNLGENRINNAKLKKQQHGLNLKYRYEIDESFGVISSLTYTLQSQEDIYPHSSSKFKWQNMSLMAGPTYRFNNYISVYGLIGATNSKISFSESEDKSKFSDTALSYGAGLQFNVTSNITIDASYESTKLKYNISKINHVINSNLRTWVLGVGYSF
ncbi:outer membrane beta-barrel protein [Xenorhabdus sp. Vera]|uniref:Ail/Lom family outer membrane beta-barrel protein n=1 Tax=Xenorhabdus koppenhoeferi TaxID=351659 RepID=UPI0019932092|nr:Ail/Lom family outer membrane beta-barrel protein [Xenorhabdus sp. Vera]MBD2810401.1 outer membrane beta-barrel protein [Xenorhabdus sp. Vera]